MDQERSRRIRALGGSDPFDWKQPETLVAYDEDLSAIQPPSPLEVRRRAAERYQSFGRKLRESRKANGTVASRLRKRTVGPMGT